METPTAEWLFSLSNVSNCAAKIFFSRAGNSDKNIFFKASHHERISISSSDKKISQKQLTIS